MLLTSANWRAIVTGNVSNQTESQQCHTTPGHHIKPYLKYFYTIVAATYLTNALKWFAI